MIKLNKGDKPAVLVENEAAWTIEYDQFKNKVDGVPAVAEFRYRHRDIKAALRTEAHDKCIYCESKISHVFPGETDHVYPSSKRRDLVVSWNNLAYICKECNREKKDYYSVAEPLIDPYVEEPSDFLLFLGPMVICNGKDSKGHRTVFRLKLQRPALFERRKERLEGILTLVQLYERTDAGDTKDMLKEQIVDETKPDREYSAYVKAFIKGRCGW